MKLIIFQNNYFINLISLFIINIFSKNKLKIIFLYAK